MMKLLPCLIKSLKLTTLYNLDFFFFFFFKLADQFCNAIGVLQQCGPPASFSNIQTAINKDQPANPTEGEVFLV